MHLLTAGYNLNSKQLPHVYKITTLRVIRTIDPQCKKTVFLHSTHITTGALPVSVANSSYSLRTLTPM